MARRSNAETRGGAVPALGSTLEFMRLLWALDHALQKRSKWMRRHTGVTGPQRLALRVIGRAPEISAGDLARTLEVHPSTLTGVLRRLTAKRFIVRAGHPDDGRRATLALTARGRAVVESSSGTIEAAVAAALRALDGADVVRATTVLGALTAALEAGAARRTRRAR